MTDNVCKKCGDDLEGCKCASVTVSAHDQSAIVENLRSISQQLEDTKTGLAVDLSASRQECDSLYRELSKVRDELITSKTERRVLSRWYEDVKTERDKLHGELVDVRSALAAATAERNSLRITLDAWQEADTKPHKRVAADDVADHVVPPVLPMCMTCHHCGNALDASVFGPYNVCTTIGCPRTVTNNVDSLLATAPHDVANHVVPPVLDMCMTCHECGGALRPSPAAGSHRVLYCRTERCSRKNTAWRDELSPYHGPCKSATPVRHE